MSENAVACANIAFGVAILVEMKLGKRALENENDIETLAEDYLNLWVSYVSKQNLMPWDVSKNSPPELEGLYRQWEAFYHKIIDPNQFSSGFVPTVPQKGATKYDEEDRSQNQPCSSPVSHDVSPDELAQLKDRLGLLAKQISELEATNRDSGKNDAGDNG